MISDEIFLAISHSCNFEDYTFGSPHNESKSCNDAIEDANVIVGEYVNGYDVILDVCYPSIVMQELRLRKYVCLFLIVHNVQSKSFNPSNLIGYYSLNVDNKNQCWSGCLHDLRKVFLFQPSRSAAGSAC